MRTDDNRCTCPRALNDGLFEGSNTTRIEAGERLVKNDRCGFVKIAATDCNLLTHAAGQLLSQSILLVDQVENPEELCAFLHMVRNVIGRGGELEMFGYGQCVEKPGFIRDIRKTLF